MTTTDAVYVPIHDITYKMNDILAELREVQAIAVEPAAVQLTINRILELRASVGDLCGCEPTQACPFEVEPETKLRAAAGA